MGDKCCLAGRDVFTHPNFCPLRQVISQASDHPKGCFVLAASHFVLSEIGLVISTEICGCRRKRRSSWGAAFIKSFMSQHTNTAVCPFPKTWSTVIFLDRQLSSCVWILASPSIINPLLFIFMPRAYVLWEIVSKASCVKYSWNRFSLFKVFNDLSSGSVNTAITLPGVSCTST